MFLGAGVLSFPYAYASTGLGAGIFVTFFLVFLAAVGLKVLAMEAVATNSPSLMWMMEKRFGFAFKVFCEVLITVYFLGAAVVFLTVIGDTAVGSFTYWFGLHWYTSRHFIIGMGAIVVLPVTFITKIRYLFFASFIAIGAILYTITLVVVNSSIFVHSHTISPHVNLGFNASVDFFFSFPIVAFAFQCHVSLIPIMYELSDPSSKRQNIIIFFALLLCASIYSMAGIFGYFLYPDPKGDLLECFGNTIPELVARIAVGAAAIFSYPLCSFQTRLALLSISHYFWRKDERARDWPFYTVVIVMVVFVGISLSIALFVDQIQIIFQFIGAIGATTFAFVVPGLVLISWARHDAKSRKQKITFFVLGFVLVIFALVTGGGSLGVTIWKLFKPSAMPNKLCTFVGP